MRALRRFKSNRKNTLQSRQFLLAGLDGYSHERSIKLFSAFFLHLFMVYFKRKKNNFAARPYPYAWLDIYFDPAQLSLDMFSTAEKEWGMGSLG
jgi:hypothetical protein